MIVLVLLLLGIGRIGSGFGGAAFLRGLRTFFGGLYSSALATKEALFRRRCNSNPLCQICGKEEDTIEHALLMCDWSQSVWFGSPLSIKIFRSEITSFFKWGEYLISNKFKDNNFSCCYVALGCWLIWNARCSFIF